MLPLCYAVPPIEHIYDCYSKRTFFGFSVSTIPSDRGPTDNFFFVQGLNTVATEDLDLSRAYGDYQFYLSYGGDQYFNVPRVIDNVFGPPGIYRQLGHILAQTNFEAAGYTAIGLSLLYRNYRMRPIYTDVTKHSFAHS